MDLRNTRTIILKEGDATEKREEIRQYFHATYSLDEQLYDTLASESMFYLRPEPLRHPLIFYLGHTATFYINKPYCFGTDRLETCVLIASGEVYPVVALKVGRIANPSTNY